MRVTVERSILDAIGLVLHRIDGDESIAPPIPDRLPELD